MKTKLLALLLAITGLELSAQVPAVPAPGSTATPGTGLGQRRSPRYTQPALAAAAAAANTNSQPDEMIPQGLIDFSGADATQVLEVYARLVNRTLLRAAVPEAKIILKTQTQLTRSEAIQALQALLAMNNISVINIGDKFVKVVTSDLANSAGAELDRSSSTNLPVMGTYITHVHQLHYVKPAVMIPLIQPFGKLQGGLSGIDDNGILVMRDYAENIKRMLEMIELIDVSVPAEFISEVIPIRYAKVDEIASALTSLGGSGGSTVSIGSAPSSSPISGFGNRSGGISGLGGGSQGTQGGLGGGSLGGGGLGARQPAGPSGGGSATSFQDRLKNIISKAGSGGGAGGGQQDQIQLFGQTKIIPNESSSTLLIYATRQDMAMIKEIIGKLDVPLAQVLVEALIMNVSIGNQFNLGISAAQNPQSLGGSILGGGGINNGPSFANFVKTVTTTSNSLGQITGTASSIASSLGTNGGAFASALPGGMSYFANLGPNYELAVKAAESDSHASIIQRPRLLASQSKPAQFFVGETRPYVTSTYNNGYSGGYGGSSYSQLSVGVELDVTPFINPDGEVTMDIQQEVDDFAGTTTIAGVGEVPNTTKRTLNTSITVRDRDTVMLGGFIKSDKSTSKSGVPFLVDIPLLGNLFSSRNDIKGRSELVVLLRPTVMRTPKLVAEQTIRETQRLPGVAGAAAEDAAYEHKLVEAERRRELRAAKTGANTNGFFNVLVPAELPPSGFPTNALEAPGAMVDPTPASSLVDPSGESLKQAEAVHQEVVATAKAAPTYTPTQKKKLDAALNNYMAGKISAEEYKAAKVKILADPK